MSEEKGKRKKILDYTDIDEITDNKGIQDKITGLIADLDVLDGKEFDERYKKVEKMLMIQYFTEMMKVKIYLTKRTHFRMRQIVDKAFSTHKFILVIAAITVIFAGLLFSLMVLEAWNAVNKEDERLSHSVLSAFFGGIGVADIFVLMKYVMNRAQRALSDLIQSIIAYLSFTYQSDTALDWIQQNELLRSGQQVPISDFISLNNSIRDAARNAIISLQKYVENIEDSDKTSKPEAKNNNS
ncbi:MAG: hypothetical protein ACT4OW_07190 [Nitrososphaerota archaeon]